MKTNGDKKLERVLTPAALVRALRDDILDGTLSTGARLTEAELAATRGVSRHSIKLALTEMAAIGLVDQEPHRGARVREISDRDIADLYWVRWIIESEAVSQASLNPDATAPLEDCVQRMERMTEATPWSEVVQADWAFHSATVQATGSERLVRLHGALEAESLLSFVQCRPEDDAASVAAAHRELLTIIQQGDPARAVKALQVHLEQSRQVLIAAKRRAT